MSNRGGGVDVWEGVLFFLSKSEGEHSGCNHDDWSEMRLSCANKIGQIRSQYDSELVTTCCPCWQKWAPDHPITHKHSRGTGGALVSDLWPVGGWGWFVRQGDRQGVWPTCLGCEVGRLALSLAPPVQEVAALLGVVQAALQPHPALLIVDGGGAQVVLVLLADPLLRLLWRRPAAHGRIQSEATWHGGCGRTPRQGLRIL